MFTQPISAIASFAWLSDSVKDCPETALLADVFWWEQRDEMHQRLSLVIARPSAYLSTEERFFCYAYCCLCVGDVTDYEQYYQQLSAQTNSESLLTWLTIEKLGRSKQYQQQAKLISNILKPQEALPDYLCTACFASLNHNGLNAKPLLTVFNRRQLQSPLEVLLYTRLLAADGHPQQALSILEKAREKWTDNAALDWFNGLLLAQTNAVLEAIALIDIAESKGLTDITALRFWLGSALSLPQHPDYPDLFLLYERIKHHVEAKPRNAAEMATNLMIRHWINGDLRSLYQLLQRYHQFQDMPEHKEDKAAQTFMRYAVLLCVAWQHNQHIYSKRSDLQTLYVLGESHSLTAANTFFNWQNKTVKAVPCFMMGSKMWHFADPKPTPYKDRLLKHLSALKAQSHLLFTIGEIDCRPDEGIWKVHKKTGRKLSVVIKSTVTGYLDYLEQALTSFSHESITIAGIPAPKYSLTGKRDTGNNTAFLAMIKEVNHLLRDGAIARGWSFLDVYAATVGEDGKSNEKWHLDGWHLQPSFYQQAEKWLLSVNST